MTAIVMRPEISMSVPGAGSQSKRNVRLATPPRGVRTSRPGHRKLAVHGDPASARLTAGSCAIENTARMTRYGAYARRMSPAESLSRLLAARGPSDNGSAGVQTWRSAMIAARLDMAATMSVRATETCSST